MMRKRPSKKGRRRVGWQAELKGRLAGFLACSASLGRHVYVASGAVLVGDVTLGDRSSVWHHAVLRADINRIVVGEQTNIQDNAVLHVADEWGCQLGDRVTVGHGALVHACVVHDEVVVGMGSIVLDGAVVGARTILGAGTLVPKGMVIPEGNLVLGRPGRVVRALTRAEKLEIRQLARKYVSLAKSHRIKYLQNQDLA